MDIEILPPDVNASQAIFSVEIAGKKRAIRYGLAALRNVGEGAMDALVLERNTNGPFKDLFDFAGRLDTKVINRRGLENLIKAGALDSLNLNRQQLMESVEILLSYSQAQARDRESNQVSLFGESTDMAKPNLRVCKDWAPLERLHHEFSAVGFYLSAHPLQGYAKNLQRMGVSSSGKFVSKLGSNYTAIKIAGIVTGVKNKVSDRGRFAFVQLSDVDGVYEASIFDEELLASSRNLLEVGTLLLVQAEGKSEEGGVRLIIQGLSALDEAVLRAQRGELHIYVDDDKGIPELHDYLRETKSKNQMQGVRVKLYAAVNDNERVELTLPDAYQISPSAMAQLEELDGISRVVEM